MTTVTTYITCSTFNGEPFIGAFVESLQRQTDGDWRLLVRDNGSTDASPAIVDRLARADERIQVVDRSGTPRGVPGTFAHLLELVPADAPYIIMADQDDVWLPEKISRTRAAMREAERTSAGPVLVHTDLLVVDADLKPIDESFWHYNRLDASVTALRRLVVRNNVTAGTAMFNRALRELAAPIPPAAPMHDWWIALVAAAFGRIVALPDRTVLYRQHGSNVIGAARPLSASPPGEILAALPGLRRRTQRMRETIAKAAAQAAAFRDRYGDRLKAEDREFLESYAALPSRGFFSRKRALLQLQCIPGNSWLQDIGILLRA